MLRFLRFRSLSRVRFGSCFFLRVLLFTSLAMAMSSRGVAFGATAATTTTLTLSSTTMASGGAVTLTATVANASNAPISPGTVTFCDASAPHCFNTAFLGTAQLNANGQAVLNLIPSIGSHSYLAKFSGTTTNAASKSAAAPLTVTGTYPTSLALSSTGTAPNYTLKATLVGTGTMAASPTGSLVFQDTSNANNPLRTVSLGSVTASWALSPAASLSASGSDPQDIVVGDFNGDGKPDLAIADFYNTITILLGNGDGTFTTKGTVSTAFPLSTMAIGDFSNDGKLDLAVSNTNNQTINIFTGNGDGTFQSSGSFSTGVTAGSIAVADFNNDGYPDLIVAGQSSAWVMLNDGTGSFSSPLSLNMPGNISGVVVGDFNGDGDMDVAFTDSGGGLTVWLGQGNGSFAVSPGSPMLASAPLIGAVVGDFNNDGVPDIAVASETGNFIQIFQGIGGGSFTQLPAMTNVFAGGNGPAALAIGDFNGDGIADLSVTNPLGPSSATQGVLIGKGDGTFAALVPYAIGQYGAGTVVTDFNGDGYSDIATPVGADNTVEVLLDQVGYTQTASVGPLSIPGPATAHLVDAAYAGDTNFTAATSNTVSLTGSPIATTLTVSSSVSSATYGQQVVLTAVLSPSALDGYSTDGETIFFKSNGNIIGEVSLSGGVAMLNITSLTAGNDVITAIYHTDYTFQGASSNAASVSVTPATPAINWAPVTTLQYGTMASTAETATSPVAGSFSYNIAPSTVLAVGSYTLTATFTPTDAIDYTSASASVTLNVTAATPVIHWATPAPVTYGTQLSGVQLDATVASTVIVPLTSYYNVHGIFTPGRAVTNGGFDNYGYAYNGTSLGTSISWNGVTYPLGPANQADAVSNITVNLPHGYFSTLTMLGSVVNNATAANTFIVKYTDGSSTTVTQSLSDWVYPMNYAGESNLVCDPSRDTASGGQDVHSTCVYGYQIALDPTKIVASLTMPPTRDVVMLAMGLTAANVPGTLVYTPAAGTTPPLGTDTLSVAFTPNDPTSYTTAMGSVQLSVTPAATYIQWATPAPITYGTPLSSTQLDAQAYTATGLTMVPLSTYYRVNAISLDGTSFATAGFNNAGAAYSSNLLGSSVSWNGITFPFGPTGVPDAVTSTTIPLPAGSFSTLSLIGAGASAQTNQTFTVTYTDGTTTATQLSLSSWTQPNNYTGETIVSTTAYHDASTGAKTTGNTYIYGYQIPLDDTKTVQSITLPSNRAVVLFGMALGDPNSAQLISGGTYVYTPPAGTILPVGTQTLSVAFTPPTGQYANGSGSTQIVVNPASLVVTAASQSVVYGTPLAPYTYTITGFVPGDTQANAVTGAPSLTTTPTTPTAVGSYPITAGQGTLAAINGNYTFTFVNGTATITSAATPSLTWTDPTPIVYGTLLSNLQLDASLGNVGAIAGATTYSPGVGTLLPVGVHTLTATFTPSNPNYSTVTVSVQLTVVQATPTITWPTPASISYGTALGPQLNATASAPIGGATVAVPGSFAYAPPAGTVLSAGQQQLSVTFTPTDTLDFTNATATVTISVSNDALTVEANNFTRLYGLANPTFGGTITGAKNGDVFTESFATAATITSDPGTYPIVPVAVGTDLNDYTVSVQDGTLTITKAPVIMTLNTSATTISAGLNVNLTASVASSTSGTPTGTVQFLSNGNAIGTATLSSGVATLATTALPVGTNTITAIYSGDTDFDSTTVVANSGPVSVNVTPLDFTFVVTSPSTVEGTYGTTRTFTLQVAPTGWEFPGDVQFAVTQTGPFFSKYSFSPATVAQNAGPTSVTLTVASQLLAREEHSRNLSRIAFGLFLLPLLGWRRSRKAGTKLRRAVLHGVLLLAALGAAGALTGCGGTYYNNLYPMTVTATSNGIQHTVTVQFQIDQSQQ